MLATSGQLQAWKGTGYMVKLTRFEHLVSKDPKWYNPQVLSRVFGQAC